MYTCVHACGANFYSSVTVHNFHMSVKKCSFHITNISHIPIILNGHTDPTFLHAYVKTQPSAISTSHVIANTKYAYQMSNICQRSKLVYVNIQHSYVHINTSYDFSEINNVTKSIGIHTFHTTSICSWTNMPATLHILIPLYSYCYIIFFQCKFVSYSRFV